MFKTSKTNTKKSSKPTNVVEISKRKEENKKI